MIWKEFVAGLIQLFEEPWKVGKDLRITSCNYLIKKELIICQM